MKMDTLQTLPTWLQLIIADDDNHLLRDSETSQEYEDIRAVARQLIRELDNKEVKRLSDQGKTLYKKLTSLTLYDTARLEGTL